PALSRLGRRSAQGDVRVGRWTYRAGALDKGKPAGRRGRNATGPTPVNGDGKASRAAWRTSPVVMAGGAQGREHGLIHPLPSQGDPIPMLERLIARRRRGSEEGFTLIELMVVVLIIAILIAIAIPTFLGARVPA